MRFIIFSVVLTIVIAANVTAGVMFSDVADFIPDPGIADTIRIESKFGGNIAPTVVSVYFYNDEPLRGVQAALTWDNDIIALDSVSFVGSRLDYLPAKGDTIRADTVVIYAFPFTEDDIEPGNGLMAKLYFSYADNIGPVTITIDSTTVIDGPLVQTSFFSTVAAEQFAPQFVAGLISFTGLECCHGIRGNANSSDGEGDQIDIADLTFMVSYSFRGGPAPACTLEGNINGSEDEAINISDLTYLVNYLFRLGPPPPPCP